jgi:hypothetical protein
MTAWIRDLTAQQQAFRVAIASRQGPKVRSSDPHWGNLGDAFPGGSGPWPDAILQPPNPQITPSASTLLTDHLPIVRDYLSSTRDSLPKLDLPR